MTIPVTIRSFEVQQRQKKYKHRDGDLDPRIPSLLAC